MELGVLAGGADIAGVAPAIAAGDDEVAVLVVAGEELVEAIEDLGAVFVGGLVAGQGLAQGVVFVDQGLDDGHGLRLAKQGLALGGGHARLETKLISDRLKSMPVPGLGLPVAGGEGGIEEGAEPPPSSRASSWSVTISPRNARTSWLWRGMTR